MPVLRVGRRAGAMAPRWGTEAPPVVLYPRAVGLHALWPRLWCCAEALNPRLCMRCGPACGAVPKP